MSKTISQLGDTVGKVSYATKSLSGAYTYNTVDIADDLFKIRNLKHLSLYEVLPDNAKCRPYIVGDISTSLPIKEVFSQLETYIVTVFASHELEYNKALSRYCVLDGSFIRWSYTGYSFVSRAEQKKFWRSHVKDFIIDLNVYDHAEQMLLHGSLTPMKFIKNKIGINYDIDEVSYLLTACDEPLISTKINMQFNQYDDYDLLMEYQDIKGFVPLEMIHLYIKSVCMYISNSGRRYWMVKDTDYNNQIKYISYDKGHCMFSEPELKNMKINIDNSTTTTLYQEALNIYRQVKYSNVIFKPYGNIKPTIDKKFFNLYSKPVFKEVPIDWEIMDLVLDLLYSICGDQPAVFEYVKFWTAHLIQFPEQRPNIGLIFQSTIQGIGKNFWWDNIIGPLITAQYYLSANGLEPFTDRFNCCLKGILLAVADETKQQTGSTKGALYDKVKSMVTCIQALFEPKGGEKVRLDNYTRYVLLSNNTNPLGITEEDRRFLVIEGNDRFKRTQSFERLDALCKTDGFFNMIYTYFNTLNLNEFNILNIPKTNAQAKMMLNNIPDTKRFIYEKAKEEDLGITPKKDLYQEFRLWCTTNGVTRIATSREFNEMLISFDIPISRVRIDSVQTYVYDLSNLLENIKRKIPENVYRIVYPNLNE